MSRPRSKRQIVPRSRKPQPDPYTSRIKREPSKRELEDTLRHAVRNHDYNALEDYDEENPRPIAGAVNQGDVSDQDFDVHDEDLCVADWGLWSDDDD